MKILSSFAHGVIDYLMGALLLLSPMIFSFADVGGAAVLLPRLAGVLILCQAALTRYELGFIRVLPFRMHLMNDYIVSALLAISPWIFGFADEPRGVWAPHLALGVAGLLVTAMTHRESHVHAAGESVND